MKFVFPPMLPAILAAGLFSSCANQKFTKAQLESMNSVSIAPMEVAGDASKRPFAGSDGPSSAGIIIGAVAGGGVGGVLGAVVGDQISKSQDDSFHQKNPGAAASVAKSTPGDLAKRLQSQLTATLQHNSFFGPRLKASGTTVFSTRLETYRLHRSGEKNGELLFSPMLFGTVHLKDSSGREIMKQQFRTVAKATRTLAEYNANPKLLDHDYNQAVHETATSVGQLLAKKTGQQ